MSDRGGVRLGIAFALAVGALSSAAAVAQDSCASAGCHASLLAGEYRHEAAESCDNCHRQVASAHPSPDGAPSFELTGNPPALCAECHDTAAEDGYGHRPYARGNCTICHAPHAADRPKLLRRTRHEICRACHADPAQVAFPHAPVSSGECGVCHAAHDSANAKLLLKAGDALCFDCHSEVKSELGKKSVHGAIDAGCTECHSPHGAANPKLLAEKGSALCAECHAEITDAIDAAALVHAPVADAKGCANCHAPHASDHSKLLPSSVGGTCLGCHDGIVTAAVTFEHAPVADDDCTACHDPHAGAGKKLFKRAFPAGEYAPYDEKAYALCFECHDAALARFPDTSFATGFRDGERNLHYLHVNKPQKGRSCVLCHNVHGGQNPMLIATRVPFGQWSLPLKYAKTETGGSCAPGCHGPQSYDRKSPVGNSEAQSLGSTND